MLLQKRQAQESDADWIWSLYVSLLKPAVTVQWGWDEAFQREMFKAHLPSSIFTLLLRDDEVIGAYAVVDNPDHLYLRMLLIVEKHQRQGVGAQVMKRLLSKAEAANKNTRLRVIKANPVVGFYTKLGFKQIEEDDGCFLFERVF